MQEVSASTASEIKVVVDTAVIGKEAVLKTCYWFSHAFSHDIHMLADDNLQVCLRPKAPASSELIARCKEDFLNMAIDYELRTRIEGKTAEIRDLILAKAFSESGILEDAPPGVFADSVEENKPDGLFKILDAGLF